MERSMKPIPKSGTAFDRWTWTKWFLMLIGIFWVFVYKLSETQVQLPDFVYVNF
jgi:hypothetical protein